MVRASSAAKRQESPISIENTLQDESREPTTHWRTISELRWRPRTGQPFIFMADWSTITDKRMQSAASAEAGAQEGQGEQQAGVETLLGKNAEQMAGLLPPLDMLHTVADRWLAVTGGDSGARPALCSFRVAGALGSDELANWLPGATARLYTLGGPVPPLPDGALGAPPLANFSVVRAPNMSFWPHLRALIEVQERESPGLELWEDLERDLALLEQELAWWIASPQGLVLNLYESEDLVGHLSLARQEDETEGCNGWGILALHIARRARGQHLGTLLQRIAATLILTRRAARRSELLAAHAAAAETAEAGAQAAQVAAADEPEWPYLFGFIAAQNIPALRGAYAAGRRIIGTYVDVPVEALGLSGRELSAAYAEQPANLNQSAGSTEG